MIDLKGINDVVIRFATVNGTGSASANNMFAKAVYKMGVPVTPKIFSLPTFKAYLHGMKCE